MDAVTHCVTSHITNTTMTTLLTEAFQATLDRYREAAAAFNSARDNVSRLEADLERHTKAADAADAEALAARSEAAALMRDASASMKQIRELKGKERAAYTLGEDYRAIIAEIQLALDEAILEARIAQCAEEDAYSGVVYRRAEELFSSAGETLQPFIHAIRILANAYACQGRRPGGAQWAQLGYETSTDVALADAFAVVRKGVSGYQAAEEQDDVLTSIERPAGLGNFEPAYGATVQKLRSEFSQRKARLREAAVSAVN
ncbi:hypothetical protein [Cupriavidus sp. DL-D2]|uniref:hypothetical protein n=1 Tax=Cupriavidus sp. DL-D2 TaxID=3144974 RepID=UPI003214FF18